MSNFNNRNTSKSSVKSNGYKNSGLRNATQTLKSPWPIEKKVLNTRTHVIKTLINVQQGHSLNNMLDGLLKDVPADSKGFTHNLLLTTLRHWHATARLLDSLADNPIDEIEVRTTIQVGITQLIYLDVAEHASIFETVESIKQLDFERASSLVNAILRKVVKNPTKYRKICDKKHSLPNWLAKQLKQDWGNDYDALTKGLRNVAPMFLRVNSRQLALANKDVSDYVEQLNEADISAQSLSLSTQLSGLNEVIAEPIRLTQSLAVNNFPSFDTGMASVQDAHAMLAGSMVKAIVDAKLANTSEHPIHILDACTAPSGKLAHCLESFSKDQIVAVVGQKSGVDNNGNDKFVPIHADEISETIHANTQLKFTAIDSEEKRLARSHQNLERIGLTNEAKIICADAISWSQNEQFDMVLLDAPCTATGVLRRHPDIGILRLEQDVEQTVILQNQILQNLWQQIKPTGYLIYATCSILKAENETQMLAFLAEHSDATEVKIDAKWGIEQAVGRQCLPINEEDGDGFYYAVLQKSDTTNK